MMLINNKPSYASLSLLIAAHKQNLTTLFDKIVIYLISIRFSDYLSPLHPPLRQLAAVLTSLETTHSPSQLPVCNVSKPMNFKLPRLYLAGYSNQIYFDIQSQLASLPLHMFY